MRDTFKALSPEDIQRVYSKYVDGNYTVVCNQNHVHTYNCIDFNNEYTMVIERLRLEVVLLNDKLTKIEEIAKR